MHKALNFLYKAKAAECQQQLTYSMAQGENMGFAQRLSYEKVLWDRIEKLLVGRRLGKRL
jgi:hypothetical protein